MLIERNPQVIQTWIKAKQTNEQEMLKQLNLLFQQPAALRPVRDVVLCALEQMLDEMKHMPPGSAAQRAMMAENGLAVWQTLPQPTPLLDIRLERMVQRLQGGVDADANDLSELMRVIGAWLEKGGGYGAPDINKAFRVGVDAIPRSAPHGPGSALKQQKEIDDKIWSKSVRQRESPNQNHLIESHVAAAWVKPKFHKQSGMQMFRVTGNDLCRRVDLLFGLLRGATISGTTTDTVLVLEAFGASTGLHPGYYLFPVATIAASLHHTLLEAGLALTLVGAVESYCVGFYSSLVPKGGLPAELASARNILTRAENDQRNRHFILWYEGRNDAAPAGCILWNKPWEIQAARRLVEAKGLLTHIAQVPRVPGQLDVAALVALMAPGLLASLPQEFQPAHFRSRG